MFDIFSPQNAGVLPLQYAAIPDGTAYTTTTSTSSPTVEIGQGDAGGPKPPNR
ncbi:MAG: hypothetical protein RL748_3185 [Pseudomonadota bacterium]|jgi:hypothetical protein